MRDPRRWTPGCTASRSGARCARPGAPAPAATPRSARTGSPSDDPAAGLLDLLAGLPPRQRAALTLRYVHDLPDAAIAKALGCRTGTVRSLLSRGREALREDLER